MDFMDHPCNCTSTTCRGGIRGNCLYGGACRKQIAVYKATCTDGKYYIGSTQQPVKNRMGSHFDEVRDLINQGTPGASFARHCAKKRLEEEGRVTRSFARKQVKKVEILWQGNPLSCVKSFRTLTCKLCQKERYHIYKARYKDREDDTCDLLNSCNEFYGACRHVPRFHRYQRCDQSTDDGGTSRKSCG